LTADPLRSAEPLPVTLEVCCETIRRPCAGVRHVDASLSTPPSRWRGRAVERTRVHLWVANSRLCRRHPGGTRVAVIRFESDSPHSFTQGLSRLCQSIGRHGARFGRRSRPSLNKSRRHWCLIQPTTVQLPSIRTDIRAPATRVRARVRRAPVQPLMRSVTVVVALEIELDEHGFGDHGTRAARPDQSGDCRQQMQNRDGEIAHGTS
jgi:hypothetical protein